MILAIPKEAVAGETRVAATAATVKEFVKASWQVLVEAGAGVGSFISDADFQQAGAAIEADPAALWSQANLILKVQGPIGRGGNGYSPRANDARDTVPISAFDEIAAMHAGQILVCMLDPTGRADRVQQFAAKGVSAFAMELVPRITRAQSMDVLSSMSMLAGYKAVLLAADSLGKIAPMMMTAAGTIHPANCMVIGAGVAGLQAVATARRLGANVRAVDTRPAAKEQVESLGARFVHLEVAGHKAELESGYARDLGEAFYQHEQEVLAPHVKECDLIITTALIPNRRAPLLITEAMVGTMRKGSVIVDLAVAAGGNCTLTKADQRVVADGVTILGPTNLPAMLPVHATQMYSRNLANFLKELAPDGKLNLDLNNDILRPMLVAHGGQVLPRGEAKAIHQKDGVS